VFAPIAATVLYVQLDPLPAATVMRLQELNAKIGFVPIGDRELQVGTCVARYLPHRATRVRKSGQP
jgi:hypothetical protein